MKIDAYLLRQVAAAAVCDERSVRKILRGERTISTVRARVLPVLERLGITPPEPAQPQG